MPVNITATPQNACWNYAFLISIALQPECVQLLCGTEADTPTFVVSCSYANLQWLAPFARLYATWIADRDATDTPLIPYHQTREGHCVFSNEGSRHDYPCQIS